MFCSIFVSIYIELSLSGGSEPKFREGLDYKVHKSVDEDMEKEVGIYMCVYV